MLLPELLRVTSCTWPPDDLSSLADASTRLADLRRDPHQSVARDWSPDTSRAASVKVIGWDGCHVRNQATILTW